VNFFVVGSNCGLKYTEIFGSLQIRQYRTRGNPEWRPL